MKIIILCVLYWMCYVSTTYCNAYAGVNKTPIAIPKHFNPVEQKQTCLKPVQKEVKNSRVLLKNIDNKNYVLKGEDAGVLKDVDVVTAARSHVHEPLISGVEGILASLGITEKSPRSLVVLNGKAVMKLLSNAMTMFLRMGAEEAQQPGDILPGLIDENVAETTMVDRFKEALRHKLVTENSRYASVGFERLCEQIALKGPEDLAPVLYHTEHIVEGLFHLGRLLWLEEPMTKVLSGLAMVATQMPIDKLKSYAIMMHFTMVHRRDMISAEVNNIINYADSFVDEEHGDHLFHILREFKDFPNVNKTGKALCRDIIEAFEKPYGEISNTVHLKRFVDIVNKAFEERHPYLAETLRRHGLRVGGNRSKRKHSKHDDYNVQEAYDAIFSSHRHSNMNHKQGRRFINEDIVEATFAPRPQISIKNYRHVSRERFTTRKQIRNYNDYQKQNEENAVRQLSMENNQFYREVSEEEFGIEKILHNTNEIKNPNEEKEARILNNYKEGLDLEVTKLPITEHTREMDTATNRFQMTHRKNLEIQNAYLNNGMITRKLFDLNIKDVKRNKGKQKRFNIINPLGKETHWIATTKPYLQIRRTTEYKRQFVDRYKFFDRRTTEF